MLIDRQRRNLLILQTNCDEERVLYHHLNICNEKTGTEQFLKTEFKDTQWEEHPRQLEGKLSADTLKNLRQFGNLCQAELGINILMSWKESSKTPPKQQNMLQILYGIFAKIHMFQKNRNNI